MNNNPCMLKIEWLFLQSAQRKAICNKSAKRICVKTHYLFNESLRSFLGLWRWWEFKPWKEAKVCGSQTHKKRGCRSVIYIYIYKLLIGVADERTMRVDSAGSLLGCSRPLTSQLCQRLWWMVIGDDERWWSWDGGDLLEFYLFFISFKWNKKMQEGIRNLGRVTISLPPWRLMVTTGGGGWWDVFEFYLFLFLLGSEIRKRKKKRI